MAETKIKNNKKETNNNVTENDKKIGSLIHFIKLIDLILSPIGFIISIILWIQNRESNYINKQGKILMNGFLSGLIYAAIVGISFLIMFIHELTGIILTSLSGLLLIVAIICINIIGPIMAGIKASNGEETKNYPLSIKILK